MQMLKHEKLLREMGQIKFESGEVIELQNRSVERISLVLLDYGGLQDRTIIAQLLPMLCGTTFKCARADLADDLLQLNNQCKEFGELFSQYLELLNNKPNMPFFNCWFLSVPQFLILLDTVTDAESFKSALWKIRHLTNKTLDFYYEYKEALRIRGK